jgi:UDP-2-acetamido-2,6-beta-L-arabino-hexul-4-ose reductase
MKTVLITGSRGFIGRNLIAMLKYLPELTIKTFDIEDTPSILESHLSHADLIFHLAGVNRPERVEAFQEVNANMTKSICDQLERLGRAPLIVLSSSIQAEQDNPYGRSKKVAEEALAEFASRTSAPVRIFRLPGVFGKWSRPNYNTVVATFCYNIAMDLPITISDPAHEVALVYVGDVVEAFASEIRSQRTEIRDQKTEVRDQGSEQQVSTSGKTTSDLWPLTSEFREVSPIYHITLGELAKQIYSFKETRKTLSIPDMSDEFTKKLYSTYLSFLPAGSFSYPLKMNVDDRGSFTEFIKTADRGQVSINISRPGITKGNHWHHTKNEKFLVISGKGVIRFRKIGSDKTITYPVSGDILEVVDIPPGYTHNITNTGQTDLVTVMWVNESFNPEKSDTFFEEV